MVQAILFLLIAAGMFACIFRVLWLSDDTYSVQAFRQFYEEPKNTIDVVLTGSSGMKEYFIPAEAYHDFGVTVGNVSTSGQMFRSVEYLVKEARKTQAPKLFVIETRQLIYEDTAIHDSDMRNVTDSIHFSKNWYDAVNALFADVDAALPDEEYKLADHFFSIGTYHNRWKSMNEYDFKDYPDMWSGYLINTNYESYDNVPAEAEGIEEEPITEIQEKALRDTLAFCKSQTDCKFLFITVPYYMEDKHLRRNAYVARVIQEEGFDYLDLNTVSDQFGFIPQIDFRDWAHVNSYGALKYTDWLTSYLKDRYDLPDRRTLENGNANEKTVHLNEEYTDFRTRLMQVTMDVNQYLNILYRYTDYANMEMSFTDTVWNNLLNDAQRAQLTALVDAGILTRIDDASNGDADLRDNALCFRVTDKESGEVLDLAEYRYNFDTQQVELLHDGEVVQYMSIE